MGEEPLALFAIPSASSSSGPYTATADWGDGTTSGVNLVNMGGIWEAWGGHAYSSMGMYAVQTLVYNAAGLLVVAAVPKVETAATTKAYGPAVVPGNSKYQFQFGFSSPVNKNGSSGKCVPGS